MPRFGKCHNYTGCSLAYSNENISVEPQKPFYCPECGRPLFETAAPSAMKLRLIYGLAGLALLILVAFAGYGFWAMMAPRLRDQMAPDVTRTPQSVLQTPAPPAPPTLQSTSVTPPPVASNLIPDFTPPVQTEDPPLKVAAEQTINLDASKGENLEVKNDVLLRIDSMPGITPGNKNKLYQSVDHARRMGKVLTIYFGSGSALLPGATITEIKTELEMPEVARLRHSPDGVFVILGYADTTGGAAINKTISQKRADNVKAAMEKKCGVTNALYSVAMGASTLLDATHLEKNRSVEIWVVLP
jgi:outer membrane protein OmpA-like peptidoglycan-associated protein